LKDRLRLFQDKTVLLTGGTGSFGRHMTEALLKLPIRELLILSRDEEKQLEMRRELPDHRIKFVIADIRDLERLRECVRADYVYHAAALKIIPTCQVFPLEAVKTNLLGTLNVKTACQENKVQKSVFISSDKACKPVNTYGMSKALAERVWLDGQPSSSSKFAAVRYGNIVGARGSVVPYFKRLIEAGKPLPITSPLMSRFLLTLEDAKDLVFLATEKMKGGEIFVPICSACTMPVLVAAMLESSTGYYPIKEVGIRNGEKIVEELISDEEMRRAETKHNYFIIHPFGNYDSKSTRVEYTSETTQQLSVAATRTLLRRAGYL